MKGRVYGCHATPSGPFEAASGGIFLDEVGDLLMDIQIACYAAPGREIERLGRDKPIPVDVG